MNKKILAVLCAALLICLGIVSTFAIVPPVNVNGDTVYSGGKPSSVDVPYIISIMNCMVDLNYFQFGQFVLVGKPSGSTSTRVYCYNGSDIVKDDSSISWGSTDITTGYYFTTQGFRPYTATYTGHTFYLTDVVCFIENGRVVENPSFVPGSLTSPTISSLSSQWLEFYNKVYFYDDNIESAYDQGVADGGAEQYREGYDDGYSDGLSDGFDTGYSDGFSTGYSSGLSIGQASGLQQGRQEGYDTGYSEGFQDGLETGYLSGKSDGYIQGNQEGFQVGLTQGRQEGYETGLDDGYETGFDDGYEIGFDDGYETGFDEGYSAGGGSGVPDPIVSVRLFYKVLDNDDSTLFLAWDGSSESTLTFVPASDISNLGYTLYYTESDFYQSQIDVPSSINFDVPAVIQDRFGYNYGIFTRYNIFNHSAEIELYKSDYEIGYNKGFQAGGNILDGLSSIASAPISSLLTALDFEIFGLDVGWTIVGIISIILCLIGWKIIKKFIPV